MRRAWAALGLMAASLGVSACLNLDNVNQVKDLRILAVRLDPPEILFSFLQLFPPEQRGGLPLGPYPMSVQVLAVDPQGREVETDIRLCPEDLASTSVRGMCEGYHIRQTAPADQFNAVRPLVSPQKSTRKADLSLGGELAVPSYTMVLSDLVIDYMLPHSSRGELNLGLALGFPTLPSVVVRAGVAGSGEHEVALKRFQLALDIAPEGAPPEIASAVQGVLEQTFGVPFCPPGTDRLADVQCVKARVPNKNPTIERVLYKMGGSINAVSDYSDPTLGGQLRDFAGRITVQRGDTVRLRIVMGDHDREPYQAFSYDVVNSRLVLTNYYEDIVYTWFTTVGDTCGTSTDSISKTADCSWDVGQDAPDGPAHVWVVVRDQRGGVDWRRFDFEVKTEPTSDNGLFGITL